MAYYPSIKALFWITKFFPPARAMPRHLDETDDKGDDGKDDNDIYGNGDTNKVNKTMMICLFRLLKKPIMWEQQNPDDWPVWAPRRIRDQVWLGESRLDREEERMGRQTPNIDDD